MSASAAAGILYTDDKELVAGVIRNERPAQDALFNRYAAGIYRLAFRMTGDADLSSDITQDTFIRAFRGVRGFRHDSKLQTWIHRIGLSLTLSAIRSRKRKESRTVSIDIATGLSTSDRHTDGPVRDRLYAAIDALPKGYRTVFVLYEIEGFTHVEIAEALGVAVSTSQGQLFRARARLRESLADRAEEVRT